MWPWRDRPSWDPRAAGRVVIPFIISKDFWVSVYFFIAKKFFFGINFFVIPWWYNNDCVFNVYGALNRGHFFSQRPRAPSHRAPPPKNWVSVSGGERKKILPHLRALPSPHFLNPHLQGPNFLWFLTFKIFKSFVSF